MHPDNQPETVTDCLIRAHEDRKASHIKANENYVGTEGGKAAVKKENKRYRGMARQLNRKQTRRDQFVVTWLGF